MTHPVPEVDGLAWRPLDHDDLDAWWGLTERAEGADRPRHRTTRTHLRTVASLPWVDLSADTLGGFDDAGDLRALARVICPPGTVDAVRVVLAGELDPAWRGRGVGRQLLAWELSRAAELAAEVERDDAAAAGLPAEVGTFCDDGRTDVLRLCEAVGLSPSRWFVGMRRDLVTHPPQEVVLPDGLRETTLEGEEAFALSLRAHNEAFRDHWGFHPESRETWTSEVDDADGGSRRDLGVLLLAGDQPVAYAVSSVREQPDGERAGHTELLGTVREWRGRGVASYLLQRSAALFQAAGLRAATLGVDASSPTGADRLYRAHGYEPVHRTTYVSRQL